MMTVRVTTPACRLCGTPSVLHLRAMSVEKYRNGALVQDAFPDLSLDDRELLISGTHPECWNNLFPEEDN